MKLRLWPWSRKIIERGLENRIFYPGLQCGGFGTPIKYARNFVIYEVTNHWTGSVTIEKEFID